LNAAIARASRLPVTLFVAPAGSGKTVALREFVETVEGEVVRFDVQAADTTLTRFVRGLAAALEPALPRALRSVALAHERAAQSARPADVLAAWLAEHLREGSRTIVVDNFHRCGADASIAAFLSSVIDRTRTWTRWIVATRVGGQLPFAKWLARGDADVPIEEATLALTLEEAGDFATRIAPSLDSRSVKRLWDATHGAIGKMLFTLWTLSRDPALLQHMLGAGGSAYEHCIDETLAALKPHERWFLLDSAMFPDLSEALVSAAGLDAAAATIAALAATIPQAVERVADVPRFSPFFADVLREWLAAGGAEATLDAHRRAGRALEKCNRVAEALGYYLNGRELSAISRLIESHGFALVDAGYGDVVQEAIEALDPIARAGSPVIGTIHAAFESRLGRFDAAESGFAAALDRATEPGLRNAIAYQYGTHLLRFKRPQAIALLEGLVQSTEASDDLHCYGRSALGPAYVFAGRNDEALSSTDAALRCVGASSNHHLRARAFHQAAFVALYRDDGARAKVLAARSLEIAQDHGYFDIAAGALTVLYNVASDLDDDPVASLRFLDEVAECAAKSGSLIPHYLALVAKLEIQVERGDQAAIEELDAKLRTADARSSGSAAYEALIASQAIRAGWIGDHAGAYRLLVASTEEQWSADRKALRWAEAAVYAAAGRLGVEAAAAIRSARKFLASSQPGHRIVRARLFLALSMILSGRSESAREMFTLVDADHRALSPRLRALRRALVALLDRYRGARNQSELLDAFGALEQQHFGGVARLILNFPLADNASLRLAGLSLPERRVLAKLARHDSFVAKHRAQRVLAKLGYVDDEAALRALARHPSTVTGGEGATSRAGSAQ
jgi:hypothetical protein